MYKSVLWIVVAVLFAVLAGPLAFVATKANTADPADLYLVVNIERQTMFASIGASKVGPVESRLAQMIHAPPDARTQLIEAGYVMLPAGAFAGICGFDQDLMNVSRRSI
jgi:hypothetical protein